MTDKATPDRSVVRVTDNDLVAAMQILACIARPHRPASAGELMQQWLWARKRYRKEGLPADLEIAVPDKNVIESKLVALAKDISAGLEAGEWLQMKWAACSDGVLVRAMGASIRQQAARKWNEEHRAGIKQGQGHVTSRDDQTAIAKQRIWTKRRPVAHMSLAVRDIAAEVFKETPRELEALLFNPTWINDALARAETYAEVAVSHRILRPGESWHFLR